MKFCGLASLVFLACGTAGPAFALDCAKASTRLEHTICSNSDLRKADDAMGVAYSLLLHEAQDPQLRAVLVASQRRWVSARERDLGPLSQDDGIDASQYASVLLAATRDRTRFLSTKEAGQPRFFAEAERQRATVATYTNTPLSGYEGSCSFIPDRTGQGNYSYNCFGTLRLRRDNRLCILNEDFATYTSVGSRAVATVENGTPQVVATCVINSGTDSACPGSVGAEQGGRWNFHPTREQSWLGEVTGRPAALDPELHLPEEEDKGWLHACLTDPSFPASNPAANQAAKP